MTTKTCIRCGKEKDIQEFNYRVKAKGTRQRYCRDCTRLQLRNHYKSRHAYYISKARKRNKAVKALNQQRLLAYLAQCACVDCGETDVVCLEFDHVRGLKTSAISTMLGTYSWNVIEEELTKCEVRCANCHRRKTARQRGYFKLMGCSLRP
jgi:hypothetical protein